MTSASSPSRFASPPSSGKPSRVTCSAEPILYWFRPTQVPVGGVPDDVRRQWVDVPLPVRDPRPVEGPLPYIGRDVIDRAIRRPINDGVAVAPADAIRSLRLFGHNDAAEWWEDLLRVRTNIESFVFRRGEGDLLPPRLAM